MTGKTIGRRNFGKIVATAVAAKICVGNAFGADSDAKKSAATTDAHGANICAKKRFPIAINAGTVRAYKLPLETQLELYARAEFDGAELWVADIENFYSRGGNPTKLKRLLSDANLKLFNVLGFAKWLDDNPQERARGEDKLKSEIVMASDLDCGFLAATGMGFSELKDSDMDRIAQSYSNMLVFGQKYGVAPLLELWGHRALHRLEDLERIAIRARHRNANFLLDFYHIYRGGNSFESLAQMNCKALPVIHIDDYPKVDDYKTLTDADRIFPGDGVCPFGDILPMLVENGFEGALSVELFNKTYAKTMSPIEQLKTCRIKTAQCVEKAFARA